MLPIVDVQIPTTRVSGPDITVDYSRSQEPKLATTAKLLPGPPLFRIFDRSGTHDHLGVPPDAAEDIEIGDLVATPTHGAPGTVFEILERNGPWSDSFEKHPDLPADEQDDWVHFVVAAARDKRTIENDAADFANRMRETNRGIEEGHRLARLRRRDELAEALLAATSEQIDAVLAELDDDTRGKIEKALEPSKPAVAA